MIEYRVRRGGDGIVTKNSKKQPISKQKLLSQGESNPRYLLGKLRLYLGPHRIAPKH